MSTTITGKRSLAVAMQDACDFLRLFDGCYERWEVAGSVRRQCDEAGDVEHVLIARFDDVADPANLFAEKQRTNLVLHKLDALIRPAAGQTQGVMTKHNYNGTVRWGERYRGVDFRGFNHELFIADADNWGPTLAMRTGPADFSTMLVTAMQSRGYRNRFGYVWNVRVWNCACGWGGDSVEFVRKTDDQRREVTLTGGWEDKLQDGTVMVATCLRCGGHEQVRPQRVSVPTEQAYFEICGVTWREPAARR
jgi:DNA polymerase/3'-5' exonuclease PolX